MSVTVVGMAQQARTPSFRCAQRDPAFAECCQRRAAHLGAHYYCDGERFIAVEAEA